MSAVLAKEWMKAAMDDILLLEEIKDNSHFTANECYLSNDNNQIVNKLNKLYIDSRYPGDMGLLPYGKPTLEDAKEFYEFALSVFDKVCNILELEKSELI